VLELLMEIPISVASIIAKNTLEGRVDQLNKQFNLDLRSISPERIDPRILPLVAKIHFKNISKLLD
jgi:ribonuclease HIII